MTKILLIVVFLLTSCSQMMRSGRYVQLGTKTYELNQVANKYGVKADILKRHNRGRSFAPGAWVFVPTEQGINASYGQFNNPYYEVIQSGEFIWPVPSSKRMTSFFGMRHGRHHDGIDIAAPVGTHILAANSGVVVYSGRRISGYGKMIIIKHENNIYSVYAHARKMYVSKGEKVDRGQVIAQVGMTGRTSGPHLHFEVRVGDDPKNPLKFLPKWVKRLASR